MMPAVMMTPMVAVVTHGAIITDLARAKGGRHKVTAWPRDNGGIIVRVPIIIGVIVVIDAPKEEATPVPETTAGETRTAGNMAHSRAARDGRSRTERTAANASATEAMTAASAAAMTVNFNP
jgi:hypothetical protein